jgi:geranylgeranyl diphosphate synthase type II
MTKTPTASFFEFLQSLQSQVDAALEAHAHFEPGCPEHLCGAIRHSLLAPGKRLRPTLVLLAAEACGGTLRAAMPAACAVEMIHAYSLIHDDLPAMDDDDLRRGRPTCHKAFGEATAILAGDALQAMAFRTLAREIAPPEVASACCAALAEAAGPCHLVGGQADDIEGESAPPPATEEEGLRRLESIHRRKTGAMIRVSLRLGGMVAAAGPAELEALDHYGRRLGLAFQIADDLLDVRGDEAAVGKRLGKDSEHGKLTFPGLLGVDQSAARAEQLISEACESLAGWGERALQLKALARYVVERNR